LRKATPQKKTLRRSRKSPSVLLQTVCAKAHRTCPVAHRTVRCPHAGLSGAPGNSSPTASSRWHSERRPPDMSGVKSLRVQRSTALSEQRIGAPDMLQCNVRWCTGLSGAPDDRKFQLSVQRLDWGVEAINTTPTGHQV
jgi:hypothetical protein